MRLYINDDEYIGTASIEPDTDSTCMVCKTMREQYQGNYSENKDELRKLNDMFDHTLGDDCIVREYAERDPTVSVDELVRQNSSDSEPIFDSTTL